MGLGREDAGDGVGQTEPVFGNRAGVGNKHDKGLISDS